MPRNGSNIFSPPAGTTATPNTSIESAKYNAFLADLTNDLNAARPIVAGGTGATTKSGAQQALDLEPGVDIQAYNATLAALAALTLAADKLIYATGANTLAAADLTTFARTLLAETDAAGVRDELGLGDMATKDDVAIADIDATGTADATTRLAGDGTWQPDLATAIAEGAVGAPKVEPQALLAPSASLIALTGTNWGAFTGLDRIKCVEFVWAVASGTGSVNLNIAFSNDGGSSWGSTQTVLGGAFTSNQGGLVMGLVDLETGASAHQLVSGTEGRGANKALTVPADCNAVRFGSSLTRDNAIRLRPIGGVV